MEVTRRQFLVMLGVGLLSVFGLSGLLGIVSKPSSTLGHDINYGRDNYGP